MQLFGNQSQPSFEGAWEKGQSAVGKVGKAVTKQAKTWTGAASSQVLGTQVRSDPVADFAKGDMGMQHMEQGAQTASTPKASSPNYAKSHMSQSDMQLSQTRVKLAALQQQHKASYFDPTFNRPQPKEQPVAEKQEQEKQQELMDLQKKKKFDFSALRMSTHRTETFRGASG